jgi:hypothetical protein
MSQSFDIYNEQIEVALNNSPFVAGTRSNTQALVDMTGTSTITATSMTYNSDGSYSFNGAGNYFSILMTRTTANYISQSWEAWVKPAVASTTMGIFGHEASTGCSSYCNGGLVTLSGEYCFVWFDNTSYLYLHSGVYAAVGQYAHLIAVWDGAQSKPLIYINGALMATYGSTSNLSYNGLFNVVQIGTNATNANYYNGTISVVKHYYNHALTSDEVKQNFEALRGRYGI